MDAPTREDFCSVSAPSLLLSLYLAEDYDFRRVTQVAVLQFM